MKAHYSKIAGIGFCALVLACSLPAGASAQAKWRTRQPSTPAKAPKKTIAPGSKIKATLNDGTGREIEAVFVEVRDDSLVVRHGGDFQLDSLMTTDSVSYVFLGADARYDPETKLISGHTVEGEDVVIPMAQVDHVHVTLTDDRGSISTAFSADLFRHRLKFKVVYPEVGRIPVSSIQTLHVWQTGKSKQGARVIGMFTGATVGLVLGISSYNANKDEFMSDPLISYLVPPLLLMFVGGALFSSLAPEQGWKKLSLKDADFGIAPVANGSPGLTFAIKVPF